MALVAAFMVFVAACSTTDGGDRQSLTSDPSAAESEYGAFGQDAFGQDASEQLSDAGTAIGARLLQGTASEFGTLSPGAALPSGDDCANRVRSANNDWEPNAANTPENNRVGSQLTGSYIGEWDSCLLYTSPSPRDATLSRMPSSA